MYVVKSRETGNPYEHILVALDGSATAEQVLPRVEYLAKRFASTVTLLRVVTPAREMLFTGTMMEPAPSAWRADLDEVNQRMREEAGSYLAATRARLTSRGIDTRALLLDGSPAQAIVHEARQCRADLIAMTTQGRGGLTRLVFGSVAEEVLRSAPCPVLLMRVPRGEEAAVEEPIHIEARTALHA
jgi:nucleotide-binding universal stress UspA family protein